MRCLLQGEGCFPWAAQNKLGHWRYGTRAVQYARPLQQDRLAAASDDPLSDQSALSSAVILPRTSVKGTEGASVPGGSWDALPPLVP